MWEGLWRAIKACGKWRQDCEDWQVMVFLGRDLLLRPMTDIAGTSCHLCVSSLSFDFLTQGLLGTSGIFSFASSVWRTRLS